MNKLNNVRCFSCPEFNIPNPVDFVNTIAGNYETVERIFMEYIDNSLDSADDLAHRNDGQYPYPIDIRIMINTENKTVKFRDNCEGMDRDTLEGIANKIGSSRKAHQNWNNGEFGFGIHTFRACAENIEIITQQKGDIVREIAFNRHDKGPTGRELREKYLDGNSGTTVIIGNFDKAWWNEISPEIIKDEVEKHFDQLLRRKNLKITVYYDRGELRCSAFDYGRYLGQEFSKKLYELTEDRRGLKTTIPLNNSVEIYLKVTEDIIPDKRPVFLNKGRRIEVLKDTKSFMNKSKYRTGLWGHDNLTGYIEVSGAVEPTITRDKFKNTKRRRMLYAAILELEDKINDALVEINRRSESSTMSKLESILSSTLSKLARLDSLRFRTEFEEGMDIDLIEVDDSDLVLKRKKRGEEGEMRTKADQTEEIPVTKSRDESDLKGKQRKKTGFNVRFSDVEQKKTDGTLLRSQFIEGDAIVIYKNHSDFQERIKRTYQGELRITERLLSYLATEIAIHYKDKFFEVRKKQPEIQSILNSRKESFINLCDFVYSFEKLLQPCVGKNIITLETSTGDADGKE